LKFRKKDKDKELKKKRAYELLRESSTGPAEHHPIVIKEIIKEREVALVNCRYCGSQMESTVVQCPHCGARRK